MLNSANFEQALIKGVIQKLPSFAASQLASDLESAYVDELSSDPGRIRFGIRGYSSPAYEGQHQYPVEIRVRDSDGAELTVILYADANDRLYELEIVRWDGRNLISPDLDSVSFY